MKSLPPDVTGRYVHIYRMLPERGRDILKILDYGSNEGYFAESIRRGYKDKVRVFAAEIDTHYISIGKKRYPKIIFLKIALGKRLPISGMDVIILSDVIEHIPKGSERRLISELSGYLKKDSLLLLSTPNKDPFRLNFIFDPGNSVIYPLKEFVKMLRIPSVKKDEKYMWEKNDEGWHRHYSLNDLKKICGRNFTIIESKRKGSILSPLFYLLILLVDMPLAYIDRGGFVHLLRNIWKYIPQKVIDFDMKYISLGPFSYHIVLKLMKK